VTCTAVISMRQTFMRQTDGSVRRQVLEIDGVELTSVVQQELDKPIKCGTFGASGTYSLMRH